jgi:Uma2 family endonuclease
MSIAETPVEVELVTHLDLPETDGKPVENAYQPNQSSLLFDVLLPVLDRLHPDNNYYAAADNGIYWRRTKEPLEGCRAPDWFYVANVPRLLDGEFRRSYVIWQEVISPLLVVEYVSGDGTEERDTTPYTGKFWVYERGIKAGYYVIWDPFRAQLEVFELVHGLYRPLAPNAEGRFRILELDIEFGAWNGAYHGLAADWLRVWENGRLVPTPAEQHDIERQRAENEHKRAEAEKLRAEAEKQRAEKLAARLRELGVDPDSV